ncbi:indoleamine 2,3-dioxygenase 2 isoform X3 [Cuculus canorus]|uniref:indoleamine 2,3-dioxygenase 2 isoform X3 n=1 Tax=Cuculus canorus TaxID=55661 RepID=UPI0023AB1478|nr:indoleamine 2,3-dioxygenase 2 isoform X3 [Cuculus canorus]
MEVKHGTEETPLPLALTRFQVSEEYGFLLPDPLTQLPAPYAPWMEIAHHLPQLIASHRLRSRVHQMPQLSTRHLRGREELHLAHLVLSFITTGYVWQEGEEGTVKVLPRNLAVPFWEVSQALGLPPILSHMDFVLANWRRKNPKGPLEIENLDTIISLPGGESLRGFTLVTLLVEKAAVPGIKAIVQAICAIRQRDEETLRRALQELAEAIGDMSKALKRMHDYVDPAVFYAVIRIFLSGTRESIWANPSAHKGILTSADGHWDLRASMLVPLLPREALSPLAPPKQLCACEPRGNCLVERWKHSRTRADCAGTTPCGAQRWKDNPAMPDGLIYEGVSEEPMAYSGGSAAQSTVLHAFDEFLGIHHSEESKTREQRAPASCQ